MALHFTSEPGKYAAIAAAVRTLSEMGYDDHAPSDLILVLQAAIRGTEEEMNSDSAFDTFGAGFKHNLGYVLISALRKVVDNYVEGLTAESESGLEWIPTQDGDDDVEGPLFESDTTGVGYQLFEHWQNQRAGWNIVDSRTPSIVIEGYGGETFIYVTISSGQDGKSTWTVVEQPIDAPLKSFQGATKWDDVLPSVNKVLRRIMKDPLAA